MTTSARASKPRASIWIVAAVAKNGVIGNRGELPWRVRSDLRKFREITMGKPLIMGRKTFQSIGRMLDGRDMIVVTRRRYYAPPGVIVATSLRDALDLGIERAAARGATEVCIGGGGEIYRQAMQLADNLHIAHIDLSPEGDTTFPKISPNEWVEVTREALPWTSGDTATAVYVIYARPD